MSWFPKWQPYQGDINTQPVATNEYLPVGQSIMLGLQHVLAMFGATVLAPLLMGFDANLAIMMSGVCTILFFLMTGGRVPSYLGSSFAFIGVVAAATAHATGSGANPNLCSTWRYHCLWYLVCCDWSDCDGDRHTLD